MGKKSRSSSAAVAVAEHPAEVPVVGMREPCPCGSGRRYKACHGRAGRAESVRLVTRPFEGLPCEADWVALREIVPAATATVRTTAEHGARDVTVTTVLPMAWPAMHRADGAVLHRPPDPGRFRATRAGTPPPRCSPRSRPSPARRWRRATCRAPVPACRTSSSPACRSTSTSTRASTSGSPASRGDARGTRVPGARQRRGRPHRAG